jgi:hypothetical protein
MAELPFNIPVEIEMIVEIRQQCGEAGEERNRG